jgi:hypothetical protein
MSPKTGAGASSEGVNASAVSDVSVPAPIVNHAVQLLTMAHQKGMMTSLAPIDAMHAYHCIVSLTDALKQAVDNTKQRIEESN